MFILLIFFSNLMSLVPKISYWKSCDIEKNEGLKWHCSDSSGISLCYYSVQKTKNLMTSSRKAVRKCCWMFQHVSLLLLVLCNNVTLCESQLPAGTSFSDGGGDETSRCPPQQCTGRTGSCLANRQGMYNMPSLCTTAERVSLPSKQTPWVLKPLFEIKFIISNPLCKGREEAMQKLLYHTTKSTQAGDRHQ